MPQRPDRLLDLVLNGLFVGFMACTAVLVGILVVEVLRGGELEPAFHARQAAVPSASAPQRLH